MLANSVTLLLGHKSGTQQAAAHYTRLSPAVKSISTGHYPKLRLAPNLLIGLGVVESLANFTLRGVAMPFENGPYSFIESRIDEAAPKQPGVYGVNNSKMIYVGQSENIHDRLKQHHADKKHCIWKHSPRFFRYDIVYGGEDARKKREKQRIDEYDPPCNKT